MSTLDLIMEMALSLDSSHSSPTASKDDQKKLQQSRQNSKSNKQGVTNEAFEYDTEDIAGINTSSANSALPPSSKEIYFIELEEPTTQQNVMKVSSPERITEFKHLDLKVENADSSELSEIRVNLLKGRYCVKAPSCTQNNAASHQQTDTVAAHHQMDSLLKSPLPQQDTQQQQLQLHKLEQEHLQDTEALNCTVDKTESSHSNNDKTKENVYDKTCCNKNSSDDHYKNQTSEINIDSNKTKTNDTELNKNRKTENNHSKTDNDICITDPNKNAYEKAHSIHVSTDQNEARNTKADHNTNDNKPISNTSLTSNDPSVVSDRTLKNFGLITIKDMNDILDSRPIDKGLLKKILNRRKTTRL